MKINSMSEINVHSFTRKIRARMLSEVMKRRRRMAGNLRP